ncbi:MAG: chromate transporter [Lachnospiraceae bacterium]|nr:chromate transporter [Lachnospiraceae bacterium]
MIYLQLFLSFMKIGFTSFGGLSMVPLILEEMQSHGWMTSQDLTNLVAIAEMTPGPLGINCATFTGTQTAGLAGSIAAILGVLTPAFTLTMLIAIFFEKFKESDVMRTVMMFVKPICIAIILKVIITLSEENFLTESGVDPYAVAIAALMLYLLMKRKWTVPKVILSAATLGAVLYGVLPLF